MFRHHGIVDDGTQDGTLSAGLSMTILSKSNPETSNVVLVGAGFRFFGSGGSGGHFTFSGQGEDGGVGADATAAKLENNGEKPVRPCLDMLAHRRSFTRNDCAFLASVVGAINVKVHTLG
jgi:hypothetical protein